MRAQKKCDNFAFFHSQLFALSDRTNQSRTFISTFIDFVVNWHFRCAIIGRSFCVGTRREANRNKQTNKQGTFPKRMNLPRTRIQPPVVVVVVGKCNLMRLRLRRLLSKLKISPYHSPPLSLFLSLFFSLLSYSLLFHCPNFQLAREKSSGLLNYTNGDRNVTEQSFQMNCINSATPTCIIFLARHMRGEGGRYSA